MTRTPEPARVTRTLPTPAGNGGIYVTSRTLRQAGPWQPLLPGIYLAMAGGLPTVAQREMAALLYAGPASMITGSAALSAALGAVRRRPALPVRAVEIRAN